MKTGKRLQCVVYFKDRGYFKNMTTNTWKGTKSYHFTDSLNEARVYKTTGAARNSVNHICQGLYEINKKDTVTLYNIIPIVLIEVK